MYFEILLDYHVLMVKVNQGEREKCLKFKLKAIVQSGNPSWVRVI